MKKIRAFFDSMEERFVFPISRRTYQINALIALIVLGACIIWLAYNSTPTSRDDVKISKSEVIQNQVDTTTVVETPVASECELAQYNVWLDSLKRDLPNEEWIKLGDSVDVVVDGGYTDYSEYSDNVDTAAAALDVPAPSVEVTQVTERRFVPNPVAIPSILDQIYSKRGLDSGDYCGKIAVIESIHYLIKKTSGAFLKDAYPKYFYMVAAYPSATKEDFVNTFELQAGIEMKEIFIDDEKTINLLFDYFRFFMEERPSDVRVDLAVNTLKNHYKVGQGSRSRDRADYFKVAALIIKSDLDDEELTKALDGYNSEMAYYSQNGLYTTIRKYLTLYEEKLALLVAKQNAEKLEKTEQQLKSLIAGGSAFGTILLVAILLLLFSIQSLLRKHVEK